MNQLLDILTGMWRRRWIGLMAACTIIGISFLATLLMKNVYRSKASLFVKLGRESVALDPTVTTSQTVTVNETRESEVNSVVEVLRSQKIIQSLVDEFGAEVILNGKLPEDSAEQTSSWISDFVGTAIDRAREFNDGGEISLRERAIRKLEKSLDVSAPKKTTVIELYIETKSPKLAQKILDRTVDLFQEEHVRVNRTSGSYDFLIEQRDVLGKRADEARAKMEEAKNRMNLISIEGERSRLQEELSMLSQQIINAVSSLKASESKVANLEKSIASLPERLQTEGLAGLPNDATDKMRETLYQLQIREKDLTTRLNPSHPQVKQIQDQLAAAEEVYSKQGTQREQKTTELNPARQRLELLLLTEKAEVASLEGRISSLEEKTKEAREKLLSLNKNEILISDLQRDIDLAENSLRGYSDKLEQSRMDRELQSQQISNVNILQKATYSEKPVSPPRLLILAGGIVFGIIGGLGTALLADVLAEARKLARSAATAANQPANQPANESSTSAARASNNTPDLNQSTGESRLPETIGHF